MRIAVVTHDYPADGSNAAAFVQARVDLYRRMGHIVSVHTRKDHGNPWAIEAADVIAAHYPLPEYVIPTVEPFLGTKPVVAYLHGAEAIATPDKGRLWGVWAKIATRAFVRRCDRAVTCSRWMAEAVEEYLGLDALVIPNPVDDILFQNAPHETIQGLCLRGVARKYGSDMLDGNPWVDRLAPRFRRDALPRLLRGYGFFVAPSRLEGQGLMACEAAATGMPIVTTDAGGIPEFIHDPISIRVRPDDAVALRRAIEVVRGELPLSGADRATIRGFVLAACGPHATVERDIALFERMIGR